MRYLTTLLTAFAFFAPSATAQDTMPGEPSFQRHQFTVVRHRGRIFLDGQRADHPVSTQSKFVDLIETFDHLHFKDDRDFDRWAGRLRGPRTYTYDDVVRDDGHGHVTATPLVLLPVEQRAAVNDAWNDWLAGQAASRAMSQSSDSSESSAIESFAYALAAYAPRPSQRQKTWEVELYPAGSRDLFSPANLLGGPQLYNSGISFATGYPGTVSPGSFNAVKYVRVHGDNSAIARYSALDNYPGYQVGSVVKVR